MTRSPIRQADIQRAMLEFTGKGLWLAIGYFEIGLCWHAGNWCVTGGWLDPRP